MTALKGRRVGHLTITGIADRIPFIRKSGKHDSHLIYSALCDCGNKTTVPARTVARNRPKTACESCQGARRKMPSTTRNPGTPFLGVDSEDRKHKLFNTWNIMVRRCHDSRHDRYPYYGARGIKVCDRWRNSFKDFVADMGPRPKGMTLDRENNNGDYEPKNCRWAAPVVQQNNKRTSNLYAWDDELLNLTEWSDRWAVDICDVKASLALGIPFGVVAQYAEVGAHLRKKRAVYNSLLNPAEVPCSV